MEKLAAERDHLAVQLEAAEDRVARAEKVARDAKEEKGAAFAKLEGAQKTRDSAVGQARVLLKENASLIGEVREARGQAEEAQIRTREALAKATVLEAEAKEARLGAARAVDVFRESAEFRKVVAACSTPMALRGFRVAKRAISARYPDLDLRATHLTPELLTAVGGEESSEEEEEEEDSGEEGDEEGAPSVEAPVVAVAVCPAGADEVCPGEGTVPAEVAEPGPSENAAPSGPVGAVGVEETSPPPPPPGGLTPRAGTTCPAPAQVVVLEDEDVVMALPSGGPSAASPEREEGARL